MLSNSDPQSSMDNACTSSLDSNRFRHRLLIPSNVNKNSTAKPRYFRNQNGRLSYTSVGQYSSKSNGYLHLNNNEEEVPMCYSYMNDCAIYGIPKDDRVKQFRQWFDWWLFSFIYDLKWFAVKESKLIFFLFLFFGLFQLFYMYYQFRTDHLR